MRLHVIAVDTIRNRHMPLVHVINATRISFPWICLFLLTPLATFGQTTPQEMAYQLFDAARSAGQTGTEAVELAAEAVWGASELSGSTTFTGTLTQSPADADVWSYTSTPSDRLLVAFHGGPTVALAFTAFDGYTDGTWEDFVDQHEVDFTVFIDGELELRIQSGSHYVADNTFAAVRQIVGSILYDGEAADINMRHEATTFQEVDSGWLYLKKRDVYTGDATTPTKSFVFNQGWWTLLLHTTLGTKPEHLRETEIRNNSTVTTGGVVYRFDDAYAYSVVGSYISQALFNVVIEPEKWEARGNFTADNQVLGTIAFGAPLLPMAYMPDIIVRFTAGGNITVPGLVGATPTSTEASAEPADDRFLLHNYPNPFNTTTTIGYTLPRASNVTLAVYDVLGRRVSILASGMQGSGYNQVLFDATQLPSGIYFSRLETEDFEESVRMLVVR